jgi:hypothetical protein
VSYLTSGIFLLGESYNASGVWDLPLYSKLLDVVRALLMLPSTTSGVACLVPMTANVLRQTPNFHAIPSDYWIIFCNLIWSQLTIAG